MRSEARRQIRWAWLCAAALATAFTLLGAFAVSEPSPAQAGSQSLSQLNSQLGANAAIQSNLQVDIGALNNQVSELRRQIALVRGREADVAAQLWADHTALATTGQHRATEARHLARLRRALRHAQTILSAQLVSAYEQPPQSLVTLVLSAHGFQEMLDQLQFLTTAEHSQQQIIAFTERAKAAAARAAARLSALQARQSAETDVAALQSQALTEMNGLLQSRTASLGDIQSARATALANVQAQGGRLRSAISTIRAQQAAAARAAVAAAAAAAAQAAAAQAAAARAAAAQAAAAQAAAAAAQAPASTPSAPSRGAGASAPVSAPASGGWAIPAAVVMCESGGQNLPPNSAGASGYYQILPSTWTGEGGTGPAAYLASKSEQDAVAARLWNGGAGASNWVCAGIVGIS